MKASKRRFHRFIRREMRATDDRDFADLYIKYFPESNLYSLTESAFLLMDSHNVKPDGYWDLLQKSLLFSENQDALKQFLQLPLVSQKQILERLDGFTTDGFRVYIDLLTLYKFQRNDLFATPLQDICHFFGTHLNYGNQEFTEKVFRLCSYQKGLNPRVHYGDVAAFDLLLEIYGEEKVYLVTRRIESGHLEFGITILYKVLRNYEHFSEEPLSWGLELLDSAH